MNALLRRFSVVTGFSFLGVLLIVNAAMTRQRLSAVVGSQSWVTHTADVQHRLTEIELLVTDAETGQRGYLFTGDANYLAPYLRSVADLNSRIDEFTQRTADNPAQQVNVNRLRSLIHQKTAELAQTIALYQAGKQADAKALVLSDRGLHLMREIRAQIDRMQNAENALATERESAYQRNVLSAEAAIYVATIVALVGLVVLAYYILRERRMAERHAHELRDREEWYRVTLKSIGDGVIATDAAGVVTYLNPIAESLTGIPLAKAKGKSVQEIFPIFNEFSGKVALNPVEKVMGTGIIVGLANHTVLEHSDGHRTPIEDSAAPIRNDNGATIGVVLVFRDASTARNSQEVLRKTEKLATAARLSATVAHEINNPLEAVVNLLFLAKTSPGASPDLIANLTMAEQELDRVAHITRQTLGFYRESNTPAEVDLPSIVEPVLKLYSNKIATKEIQIRFVVDAPPRVLAVAGELKQVVSNLLSNAIDAVPNGGTIAIRCDHSDTSAGPMAKLLIEDSGPGIAPDVLDRIFDPFFTTKQDVGTGLGLWVAKEIISRHGGNIQVRPPSEHNGLRGAAFVIQLPSAAAVHE